MRRLNDGMTQDSLQVIKPCMNMQKSSCEYREQNIRRTVTVRVNWKRNWRAEGQRATGRHGRLTFPATLISVDWQLNLLLTSLITIKLFIRLISQAESKRDPGERSHGGKPGEWALRAGRHGNRLGPV